MLIPRVNPTTLKKAVVSTKTIKTESRVQAQILTSYRATRGFPKKDVSGTSARIVLQQNKFSKILPLKGIEPATLGL